MIAQVGKLLHDAQASWRFNLANGFIAGLLVVAPGTGLARHGEGANAVDDTVIAIHVAVQTPRFAVGDDVHASPLLIQDGNIHGVH